MVDATRTFGLKALKWKYISFENAFGACKNRKVLGVLWHRVNFVTRQLCNVYVTLSYVVIFGSNPKIQPSPDINLKYTRISIYCF